MSIFRPIIEPLLREHMREVSAPVMPPPSEPEQPASENRAEFAERTHERYRPDGSVERWTTRVCMVCDFEIEADCPRGECPHKLRELLRRAVTIIEAETAGYQEFMAEARAAAFGVSPSVQERESFKTNERTEQVNESSSYPRDSAAASAESSNVSNPKE